MNREIKEAEERILKDKTPEEQEKIKKEWEQNKIKTEQETLFGDILVQKNK